MQRVSGASINCQAKEKATTPRTTAQGGHAEGQTHTSQTSALFTHVPNPYEISSFLQQKTKSGKQFPERQVTKEKSLPGAPWFACGRQHLGIKIFKTGCYLQNYQQTLDLNR